MSDSDSGEYDALTELFLGDASLAPKPAAVGAGRAGPSLRHDRCGRW
ncbi:MAG: hypothetical protein R3B49_06265 [Phycisphaerales bacterium]